MPDNLADKLAELRAQGYTGDYPGDNWFTDINKGVQHLGNAATKVNKVVQNIPVKPENIALQYKVIEQVGHATVGSGQIIVRDNPGLDLSSLNRDPSSALTKETKHDFAHGLNTPFETLDQFASYAKMVAIKSQDIEEYGFTTVVEERIDRGKSELEKGRKKLLDLLQTFSNKFKNNFGD